MENNILDKIKITYQKSLNQNDTFTPYHTRFDVIMEYNGEIYETSYQCNYKTGQKLKKDIIYCLLMDADCFENCQDIDDFQMEFGYEKASELIKAYNGCKETYQAFKKIFNDKELEELRTIFKNY